jgi:hypothetical protein
MEFVLIPAYLLLTFLFPGVPLYLTLPMVLLMTLGWSAAIVVWRKHFTTGNLRPFGI